MRKTETITTILKADSLNNLIELFKDLSKINDKIRIKIENNIFLAYAIDDQNNLVLAFKYYRKNVFDFFDDVDLDDLDFVLLNLKKVTSQLSLYQSYNLPITCTFECEDGTDIGSSSRMVKNLEIKNGKLRTFISAGEPFLVRNLAKKTIDEKVDPMFKKFGFEVSIEDYSQIIKLIGLDSLNETVEILLDGKEIIFRERGWELVVADTTIKESLMFKKKYLSNLKPVDIILIDLFENYMVIRGADHDLMISLEKTE